jgi:hypothetical protein
MSNNKIYLAGPMTGFPNLNWDAFFRKEEELSGQGWDVVNPARLDRDAGIDPNREMGEYDYTACAYRDVLALLECSSIYLMSDWQHSKGACWERALAKHHKIRRFYEIPRVEDR